MKYPKVLLLVTDDLSSNSATSITVLSLFSNWPKENISIIHTNKSEFFSEYNSYYLNLENIYAINLLNSFKLVLSKKATGLEAGMIPDEAKNLELVSSHLNAIKNGYGSLFNYNFDHKLFNFIQDFNPDLLYSILGNNRFLKLSLSISESFKIPIVPHFMDDWVNANYKGFYNFLPRIIQNLRLKKILKNSLLAMCISEKMTSVYKRRFNNFSFYTYMNCVNIDKNVELKKPVIDYLKIIYVGGLHLNRYKTLIYFDGILNDVNKLGKKCKIEIYCPNNDVEMYGKELSLCNNIQLKGFLNKEEVNDILMDADVLLHVESFDRSVFEYIRLSISTKIPQYLAARRPIIGIGPLGIASIDYLSSNKAALVINSLDYDSNLNLINKFIQEDIYRNSFAENAFLTANKFHSREIVSESLRGILCL